jgi:hypothetical protein
MKRWRMYLASILLMTGVILVQVGGFWRSLLGLVCLFFVPPLIIDQRWHE